MRVARGTWREQQAGCSPRLLDSRFINRHQSLYRSVSNKGEIPFQKTIGGSKFKLSGTEKVGLVTFL